MRRPKHSSCATFGIGNDPFSDYLCGGRVEGCGRFVEKKKRRRIYHGFSKRSAGLFTGREDVRFFIRKFFKIEFFENFWNTLFCVFYIVNSAEDVQILGDS